MISYLPLALQDLIEIGDHFALYNAEAAATLVRSLQGRCDSLADLPRRYPLVPRFEHFGLRRCIQGNYLIFYRVRENAIDIVRILHGASDYESLLFPS